MMINIVFGPPVILGLFLLFRRIFVNSLNKRFLYATWVLPTAGLFSLLFFETEGIYLAWNLSESVKAVLSAFMRVAGFFGFRLLLFDSFSRPIQAFFSRFAHAAGHFRIIWLSGMAVFAGYHLVFNLAYVLRMKKSGRRIEDASFPGLAIYESAKVEIPFLFWNTVFIPCGMSGDAERYRYTLSHEYRHYLQGEPFWNMCRTLMTVLFWFHPIVWIAVAVSKGDSEFACDEATVRQFNREEKSEYGKVIASFAGVKWRQKTLGESYFVRRQSLLTRRVRCLTEGTDRRKGRIAVFLAVAVLVAVLAVGFAHGVTRHNTFYGSSDGQIMVKTNR